MTLYTVELAYCADQWRTLAIGDRVHRYQQAHGCGHRLDRHTDGMRCRVCGRDCARADGETLQLETLARLPVGLDTPDDDGRLFP